MSITMDTLSTKGMPYSGESLNTYPTCTVEPLYSTVYLSHNQPTIKHMSIKGLITVYVTAF